MGKALHPNQLEPVTTLKTLKKSNTQNPYNPMIFFFKTPELSKIRIKHSG